MDFSKKLKKEQVALFIKTHRVQVVAVCIVVVLLIVGGVAAAIVVKRGNDAGQTEQMTPTAKKEKKEQKKEEPKELPRKLDGVIVPAAEANKVPACVMIENAAFGGVRPQAGLSKAQLVYEVIVEGGITRFMAMYAGTEAPTVGPVRSARDTFLEFASEYNCSYTHAGGSFTAIQALRNFEMRHVDALIENQFFYRDPKKISPHNLFTSTERLYKSIETHSWHTEQPPTYDSWKFIDPIDAPERPLPDSDESVETITIGFGGSYDVSYAYNRDENRYHRSNGRVAQKDENDGAPIAPVNVIVQRVGEGISVEGKGRVNWPVTGEGEVLIFNNGAVQTGVWRKENRLARTKFYDSEGTELVLVRGNTWVEIAPSHIGVEYQ